MKKTKKYPDWEKKCLALESKFLEMYERIKVKEEELKEEEDHCTKEFFYRIGDFTCPKRKLFEGFKWRSKGMSYAFVR